MIMADLTGEQGTEEKKKWVSRFSREPSGGVRFYGQWNNNGEVEISAFPNTSTSSGGFSTTHLLNPAADGSAVGSRESMAAIHPVGPRRPPSSQEQEAAGRGGCRGEPEGDTYCCGQEQWKKQMPPNGRPSIRREWCD